MAFTYAPGSIKEPRPLDFILVRMLTGGDERVRTAGLLRAKQALSHLSYTPSHSRAPRPFPIPENDTGP